MAGRSRRFGAVVAVVALLLSIGPVTIASAQGASPLTAAGTGKGQSGQFVRFVRSRMSPMAMTALARVMGLRTSKGEELRVYSTEASGQSIESCPFSASDWSSSRVNNLGKAAWVVANGYPTVSGADLGRRAGVPPLNDQQAIMVTQAAVWHFTMGIDPGNRDGVNIRRTYEYLINNARDVPEPEAEIELSGADARPRDGLVGPFRVNLPPGEPVRIELANAPTGVHLFSKDLKPVTKAADGDEVYISQPADIREGGAEIIAEGGFATPAGRLFAGRNRETPSVLVAKSDGRTKQRSSLRFQWTRTSGTDSTVTVGDNTTVVSGDPQVSTPERRFTDGRQVGTGNVVRLATERFTEFAGRTDPVEWGLAVVSAGLIVVLFRMRRRIRTGP